MTIVQNTEKSESRKRGQRGQALVELMLVTLVFFVLIVATADLARVMIRMHQLTQVAREGARVASLVQNVNSSDGREVVLRKMRLILDEMDIPSDSVTITIVPVASSPGGDGGADIVDVRITQSIIGALGGISLWPGTITNRNISAQISMPLFTSGSGGG